MKEKGLILDMPDSEYHKQGSREEHFYSSSQLKTMLEDPQKFYQTYILGKTQPRPQALQDAFDTGTLVHTAILEPKKLKGSYTIWETGNRTGKIWEDFVAHNQGKLILNKTMKGQAENSINAIKKSKLAMDLFKRGMAEASFFCVDFCGIKVKVRSDWLSGACIIDLKTTTGNVRDEVKIKNKIKQINYDLSAALYMDVINTCIKQYEIDIPYVEHFLWVFASKDRDGACQVYSAAEYMPMGRAKYLKAIELIKYHEANNWRFPEKIITLRPFGYEVSDWIRPEEKKKKKTINTDSIMDDEDLL